MDIEKLAETAAHQVNEHGGVGGIEHDAEKLAGIAGSNESLVDKAKDAAAVLKEEPQKHPGQHEHEHQRR
jgi:hypothetical protein